MPLVNRGVPSSAAQVAGVRLRRDLVLPNAVAAADDNVSFPETQARPEQERSRQWFVFFVICVLWMVLLEGVLRKWVAPGLSQILFFCRDPFLLLAYLSASGAGQRGNSHPLMFAGMALGFFAIPLLLLTVMMAGDPMRAVVGVYGWRAYFLYIPLPFLMASLFRKPDVDRFVIHLCYGLLVTAAIAVVQAGSPANSIINQGIAEDEALQFKAFALTGDKIRPNGVFTSTTAQSFYVTSAFAVMLSLFLYDKGRRACSSLMMLAVAGAALSAVAVSGSRGNYLFVMLTLVFSAVFAFIAGSPLQRTKAISLPVAMVGIVVFVFPVLFPDSIEAMLKRVENAARSESAEGSVVDGIGNRIYGSFFYFTHIIPITPVQGFGLGVGTNARRILGDPEDLRGVYTEAEWSRHFVDLGLLFGVIYILFRIALTLNLLSVAWKAATRNREHMPFLLFASLGLLTFNGQVTGHGSVGGIFWLMYGLALASAAVATEQANPSGRPTMATSNSKGS